MIEGRRDVPRRLGLVPFLLVLLVVLVISSGCQLLQPEAATQLDLAGTSWQIDGSSDAAITPDTSPLTLTFITGDLYEVRLPCGAFQGAYTWDTDGSALGFGPLPDRAPGCDASAAATVLAFAIALRGTTSWTVQSQHQITLHGQSDITLKRVRDTDTSPAA